MPTTKPETEMANDQVELIAAVAMLPVEKVRMIVYLAERHLREKVLGVTEVST